MGQTGHGSVSPAKMCLFAAQSAVSGTFVNTLTLSLHPRGLLHSPIAMAVGDGSQFEINKDYSS
jgi:hypothetical protein